MVSVGFWTTEGPKENPGMDFGIETLAVGVENEKEGSAGASVFVAAGCTSSPDELTFVAWS